MLPIVARNQLILFR